MKKIYTRTGDDGTTALFGGPRVGKTHPRLEAYGTVDETNAHIGLALSFVGHDTAVKQVRPILERIQRTLFTLGADLATPEETQSPVPRIQQSHTQQVEEDIDALSQELPPLEHFILPGGTKGASCLQVARTTCRRAERLTVAAAELEPINEEAIRYLNRLSDLLFVLARTLNRTAGVEDVQWLSSNDSSE